MKREVVREPAPGGVNPDVAAPDAPAGAAGPSAKAAGKGAKAAGTPGGGARLGAWVLMVLIVGSLALYVLADRWTPSTSQARLQAFVVPVAAEVAGKVVAVHIRNNDPVQPGQLLFAVDPQPYRIAVESARANLESVQGSVQGSAAAVDAARASLAVAEAGREIAERDAGRLEKLYQEDSGAISVRRLEIAQSTRDEARSKVQRARADLRKAQEAAGRGGGDNSQLRSAVAALDKAELDLRRTSVFAPARGVVTDLRTDVGQFAQPGAPVMTLIAMHDLWISADLTENNIGHVDPGDEVAIVLDVLPGEVLKGRVRSVGGGVGSGQSSQPGALPVIENSRDWLRQAQRIPVAVEFDPAEAPRLAKARIGGQADVLVYTGDNPVMNALAAFYMRVVSWVSYFY
jgi:multidrug resistance efflux pump